MSQSSADANHDLVRDRLEQEEAERLRVRQVSRWADELKQAACELEQARSLRQQIEATRHNGRTDNGERLRELGKEHYRLTGAGGGAG